MSWSNPTQPNVTDYTAFLRSIGISADFLPGDSMWIGTTLGVALNFVSQELNILGGCQSSEGGAAPVSIYVLAVYNFAADRLINYAPDVNNQTFFREARESYGIMKPSVGVVAGASDQGTSGSLLNPEFTQHLTLMDLQQMKTPWGRQYMEFAQMMGTLWGMS